MPNKHSPSSLTYSNGIGLSEPMMFLELSVSSYQLMQSVMWIELSNKNADQIIFSHSDFYFFIVSSNFCFLSVKILHSKMKAGANLALTLQLSNSNGIGLKSPIRTFFTNIEEFCTMWNLYSMSSYFHEKFCTIYYTNSNFLKSFFDIFLLKILDFQIF